MRTMLELMEERDRLTTAMNTLKGTAGEEWTRWMLTGALAMAEWMRGQNSSGNAPRPSVLVLPENPGR